MGETQTLPVLSSLFLKDKLSYGDGRHHVKNSITEPDNGQSKSQSENLQLESDRLDTFKNWKSKAISPENLAKAGFYFLDSPLNQDLVKCAFCKVEICHWEESDDALEEHIRWSPNCPFAKKINRVGGAPSSSFVGRGDAGQDVCGNGEPFPNSMPENEAFRLVSSLCKNYDDVKARLDTFEDWPSDLQQKPEALAEAGFRYLGVEDHTVCFRCKGALRDWKDGDDPWEQHALWFPQCAFLLEKKGREYVEEVQLRSRVPYASSTKEEDEEAGGGKRGQNSASPRDDGVFTCKICDSEERNVMLLPCRHIIACEKCSALMDKCPVCRKEINERMKVFLA